MSQKHILIVEDSPSLARTYQAQLEARGLKVKVAGTGKDAREAYPDADCVLLDLGLPDEDGFDILVDWKALNDGKPVIVVTANGSINVAIKAMQAGAEDFLVKPFPGERLTITVENTLEKSALVQTLKLYEDKIDRKNFGGFIGKSLEMQAVYQTLESAAKSKATVMITGDSGTGKELAARAIHDQSPRAGKPFVPVNCGAIPRDLIESELFGHVKGAFTGASNDREGAASMANGGTLFLDEIGEMPIEIQAKLLRFLQLSTFQKVGSAKTITADIRFVAATNREPLKAVQDGLLREDLYYRLNVLPIELPPLYQRGDDVLLIARHYMEKYAEEEGKQFTDFSAEAQDLLASHNWPGNVRELENMVRQVIVLNEGETIEGFMINTALMGTTGRFARGVSNSENTQTLPSPIPVKEKSTPKPFWQAELDLIDEAIAYCNGNVQKAAQLLEINPSTIYRKRARAQERTPSLQVRPVTGQ